MHAGQLGDFVARKLAGKLVKLEQVSRGQSTTVLRGPRDRAGACSLFVRTEIRLYLRLRRQPLHNARG